MTAYEVVEKISESRLEDLVRQHCDKIEKGMRYLTHQKQTAGGRLDVLMADEGNALVLAELKVVEDDNMLLQALDYYDHVSKNIEAIARLFKDHRVDPKQSPRIILIAPTFSQRMLNRAKWIVPRLLLVRYQIVDVNGAEIPIFIQEKVEPRPAGVDEYPSLESLLNYNQNDEAKSRMKRLIGDFEAIDQRQVSIDAIKGSVSLKYAGTVFAYLEPLRQSFNLWTYDENGELTRYAVTTDDELKSAYDRAANYIGTLKR